MKRKIILFLLAVPLAIMHLLMPVLLFLSGFPTDFPIIHEILGYIIIINLMPHRLLPFELTFQINDPLPGILIYSFWITFYYWVCLLVSKKCKKCSFVSK